MWLGGSSFDWKEKEKLIRRLEKSVKKELVLEKELLVLFPRGRRQEEEGEAATQVCSNVCRYVLQNYCSLTGGEVVLTSMWVGSGVTQPLSSVGDLVACSRARLH